MANSEDTLVDELREHLQESKTRCFIYKLHGGPFQPGLPDLLISMERKAALIEAKWATDADFDKPVLEVFTSKLTDKQASNLGALAALAGPLRARALVGGAVECDELPGGKGTICVAFDVADAKAIRELGAPSLIELASYLLDLRRKEPGPLPPAIHLIQCQLKARGEDWLAAHLLGGIQYFGPMTYQEIK